MYLMICYLVVFTYIGVVDCFILSVQDFRPGGCRGIDKTPWNLDRFREWNVGF